MTSDMIARMRAALATMNPMARTVFERVRLEDRSYQAIADELGLGVPEIEALFADALLHIWRHLDEADRP